VPALPIVCAATKLRSGLESGRYKIRENREHGWSIR
jgi:hypothetical protein